MSQEFYETDRARGFVRGYSFEMLRGIGPVSTALFGHVVGAAALGRRTPRRLSRSSSTAPPGWWSICEDLPEAHNRVTLDPELVDSNGIPAPKIAVPAQREQRAACSPTASARAKEVLEAAGAVKTFAEAPLGVGGLAPDGHRAHGNGPGDARS